uniref:Bm10666 n=1 Tax=Brugia malayi TaxID=6279 RepID=A0A0J9Y813_BRUMA|nr:Bm10666 [Brugia malayi]
MKREKLVVMDAIVVSGGNGSDSSSGGGNGSDSSSGGGNNSRAGSTGGINDKIAKEFHYITDKKMNDQ